VKHEHFACSTLLLLLNVFVIEKSCPRGSLIRVPLTRSFCVCVTLLTNNQQIRVLICAQTTWSLTENFPAWDSAMNEWIKTARNVVSTDYAEPSGRSRLYSSRPAALTMAFFSLLKSPFPLLPFFLTPPTPPPVLHGRESKSCHDGTHTHTCTHTNTFTYAHTPAYTHRHIDIQTHRHTHTHTHTYSFTHTRTHNYNKIEGRWHRPY